MAVQNSSVGRNGRQENIFQSYDHMLSMMTHVQEVNSGVITYERLQDAGDSAHHCKSHVA